MDSQTTNSLLNKLRLLAEAGQFFLTEENRAQLYKGFTYEATEAYIKQAVLNLGFTDYLIENRTDLLSFLTALNAFLNIAEESNLQSIVPVNVLDYLKEELDEKNLNQAELLEKVRKENEARIAQLIRLEEVRKRLEEIRKEKDWSKEMEQALPDIAENIEPKIASLRQTIEKAQGSEKLKDEVQITGKRIIEEAVKSSDLPPETEKYLLSREFSSQTIIDFSKASSETEKLEILSRSLKNINQEELNEKILIAVANNIVNLPPETPPEEIKEVVALSVAQQLSEIPLEKISSDQILNLVNDLSFEAQKIVSEPGKIPENIEISPVLVINQKGVFLSLTAPRVRGNPQGDVCKIVDGERTFGQDFLIQLRRGTLNLKENAQEINQKIINLNLFALTIYGVSSDDLEKASLLSRSQGNLRNANQLHLMSGQLQAFHQQYFYRSSLPQQWIVNRITSSSIYKTAGAFLSKTGIGQTIKLGVGKVAQQIGQEGLQKLWSGLKIGANKLVAKGIGAILGKLGLQALATVTLPVIGNVIAFLAPMLIKGLSNGLRKIGNFVFSGFGLANTILSGITGNTTEESKTGWLKPLIIGVFGLIFLLSIISFTSIGGAFVGKGGLEGGQPINPGPPTFPEIQCPPDKTPRHLAEDVICRLTQNQHPCDQGILNTDTRGEIRSCIDSKSQKDFPSRSIFREGFWYTETYYSFQCLQFVNLVNNALGNDFNVFYDSAGEYYDSPPPNYKEVTNLEVGDIVVYKGSPGHIAFYLGSVYSGATPDPEADIVVAEANTPRDGQLHVGTRPIDKNGYRAKFFRVIK